MEQEAREELNNSSENCENLTSSISSSVSPAMSSMPSSSNQISPGSQSTGFIKGQTYIHTFIEHIPTGAFQCSIGAFQCSKHLCMSRESWAGHFQSLSQTFRDDLEVMLVPSLHC